jgi:hypothetical protein
MRPIVNPSRKGLLSLAAERASRISRHTDRDNGGRTWMGSIPYQAGFKRNDLTPRAVDRSTRPAFTHSAISSTWSNDRRQDGNRIERKKKKPGFGQPADADQWEIRKDDVPRHPLQATECLLDPCEDLLGRCAIQNIVSDVSDEGSRGKLGQGLQRPPQARLEDARQSTDGHSAPGAIRSAVPEGSQHLNLGAPCRPGRRYDGPKPPCQIARAECDNPGDFSCHNRLPHHLVGSWPQERTSRIFCDSCSMVKGFWMNPRQPRCSISSA